LQTAVLRGLLSRLLDLDVEYGVNYVNAPSIARDRGIQVVDADGGGGSDYTNALHVRVEHEDGVTEVQGAVFADTARLTRIGAFRMEAVADGHILMLHNHDVPGVVGRVGTLLGERQINIAGLELGREAAGGMALSLVHVDEPVPADVLDEVRRLPQVVSAELLEL
jgi:D-3-phosphoglycerate dehydrogenase